MKKKESTYSGDLNNRNIWIIDFYLSGIQMSCVQKVVQHSDHHLNTGPLFKRWSENQIKFSPVFERHSNTRLFGDEAAFNHLNTRLVQYSDPHHEK